MIIEKIPEIQKLRLVEKAQLANELIDQLDAELEISGDEGHLEILEERRKLFEVDPDSATDWNTIKLELKQKLSTENGA
jgi:hypothetical protein